MQVLAYVQVPAGHTTTCVNDCKWLWTGGPGAGIDPAVDWGGRPIWVTDLRDPHNPKVHPTRSTRGRNDGMTDYAHDVQVDSAGVAWVVGPRRHPRLLDEGAALRPGPRRAARRDGLRSLPYAGGGIAETAAPSRFFHNSWHPAGDLIYGTEEDFRGGCAADGAFVISVARGELRRRRVALDAGEPVPPADGRHLEAGGPAGVVDLGRLLGALLPDAGRDRRVLLLQPGRALPRRQRPASIKQVGYFRPANGTSWAPYFHKGLVYTADRNGVYVLRSTVEAGQLQQAVAEPRALSARADDAVPEADPEVERLAALARPDGFLCSLPLDESDVGSG